MRQAPRDAGILTAVATSRNCWAHRTVRSCAFCSQCQDYGAKGQRCATSALGQKRTFADRLTMSAFDPKQTPRPLATSVVDQSTRRKKHAAVRRRGQRKRRKIDRFAEHWGEVRPVDRLTGVERTRGWAGTPTAQHFGARVRPSSSPFLCLQLSKNDTGAPQLRGHIVLRGTRGEGMLCASAGPARPWIQCCGSRRPSRCSSGPVCCPW